MLFFTKSVGVSQTHSQPEARTNRSFHSGPSRRIDIGPPQHLDTEMARAANNYCNSLLYMYLRQIICLANLHFWWISCIIDCVGCMDRRSTENEFSGSEKTLPAASNLMLPARYFAGVRSEIGRSRRRFGLIVCKASKRSARVGWDVHRPHFPDWLWKPGGASAHRLTRFFRQFGGVCPGAAMLGHVSVRDDRPPLRGVS